MSQNTGYRRNYNRLLYASYADSEQLIFDVSVVDHCFHLKKWMIGMKTNDVAKVYLFSTLPAADTLLPSTTSYWFAWYAFHPDTLVYGVYQSTQHDPESVSGDVK